MDMDRAANCSFRDYIRKRSDFTKSGSALGASIIHDGLKTRLNKRGAMN